MSLIPQLAQMLLIASAVLALVQGAYQTSIARPEAGWQDHAEPTPHFVCSGRLATGIHPECLISPDRIPHWGTPLAIRDLTNAQQQALAAELQLAADGSVLCEVACFERTISGSDDELHRITTAQYYDELIWLAATSHIVARSEPDFQPGQTYVLADIQSRASNDSRLISQGRRFVYDFTMRKWQLVLHVEATASINRTKLNCLSTAKHHQYRQ